MNTWESMTCIRLKHLYYRARPETKDQRNTRTLPLPSIYIHEQTERVFPPRNMSYKGGGRENVCIRIRPYARYAPSRIEIHAMGCP